MRFGHFDDAHREYVITTPQTPLPWINYLGSEDFFSLVSNTAGGYSFYRDARLRRLTRYRYNSSPLDMDGHHIYIKDGGTVWNPGWQPTKTPLDRYSCRHGLGYTILEGEKDGICAAQELFVPKGDACELDRLTLTPAVMAEMRAACLHVARLPDPVGATESQWQRPNGLLVGRMRVPLGVIAMIYEARPNVTIDAAILCIKAGNAVILRGGKEAIHSNLAIAGVMREAVAQAGLPRDSVQLVEDTSRQSSVELMELTEYLDVLIPRGGAGLIKTVVEKSKVPVIETGVGNCHVYIDSDADLEMAASVVYNAKTSRPSVCNAEEVCLVHSAIAQEFLPKLAQRLGPDRVAAGKLPVELRLDARAAAIIPGTPAGPADFDTEFLDYILAVKVVDSVDEAIAHIAQHSTGHSEAVLTRTQADADRFTAAVDSAAVYVNCSTRFTDGGEFGLGCEMGISTQKLHARGPMGLEELCSYKYIIHGDGQIR